MESKRSEMKSYIVSDVVLWIEDNIQDDIKSKDVTKLSGYTHWHFQKMFRSETGYSLAEYIRLIRILSVSEALAKSHFRITHIATDYNFPTQQSLSRLFRKYFNCTPSEFRRATKAIPDLYARVKSDLLAGKETNFKELKQLKSNVYN